MGGTATAGESCKPPEPRTPARSNAMNTMGQRITLMGRVRVVVLGLLAGAMTLGMSSQTARAQPSPAGDDVPAPAKIEPGILDRLSAAGQRLVEEHAKYFVVTFDGTYWDRQLWLKRQELRDRMRKAVSANRPPSDVERAYGASSTAPVDPDDESEGIEH